MREREGTSYFLSEEKEGGCVGGQLKNLTPALRRNLQKISPRKNQHRAAADQNISILLKIHHLRPPAVFEGKDDPQNSHQAFDLREFPLQKKENGTALSKEKKKSRNDLRET